MINLCLLGHDFRYELEKLIRIFFPFEKIIFLKEKEISDFTAVTEILSQSEGEIAIGTLYIGNDVFEQSLKIDTDAPDLQKERELKLALCLFEILCKACNYKPEWGILTGVRPAKLFSRLSRENGEENTLDYFKNTLKVSDKKIELCREAVKGESKIISLSTKQSFSLYISVPFCPSRCSYCSFVSHSVEQAKKLIPQYVEFLCRELEELGKIAKDLKLQLKTVYIGGGTPTTLTAQQLTQVMNTVKESFDLKGLLEYTVEAGRPDTITQEKLLAIKNGGATRISINPQTMNDSVLKEIGRNHTAEQTLEAFKLARELGFGNINTDLIAGLPTDTIDGFKLSLEKVLALQPESVTVHSLSLKRSSNLSINGILPDLSVGKTAADMVDYAHSVLSQNDIVPYYMYRQSKTVGNLENVGYAKQGYEGLYNVYIMDETHTIFAAGASAVTKLRDQNTGYIERIFNYKYPYEYINRFDEMLARKEGIYKFYE